jgi:glycolate oxidase FAD binding subunit
MRFPDHVVWRSDVPRSATAELIELIEKMCDGESLTWHAGLGYGRIRVIQEPGTEPGSVRSRLQALRETARSMGGSLVIESAPSFIKEIVDAWGASGPALEIMRRLKHQLDPQDQFSPGRFARDI